MNRYGETNIFMKRYCHFNSSGQLQNFQKKHASRSCMKEGGGQDTFLQQVLFCKQKSEKNPCPCDLSILQNGNGVSSVRWGYFCISTLPNLRRIQSTVWFLTGSMRFSKPFSFSFCKFSGRVSSARSHF